MLLFILANSAVAFFTMRNAIFHQDTLSSLIEARLRTNTSTVLVYHHVSHRVIGTLMVPTEFPSDRVVTLVVRQLIDCPPTVMIPTKLSVTATCGTVPNPTLNSVTSLVMSHTAVSPTEVPTPFVTSRPPNPTSVVAPPTLRSTVEDPHFTTVRSPTSVVAPPTLTSTVENPPVFTTFPRSPTSVVAPSVFTTVTNPPVTSTLQDPISPTLTFIPVIFSTSTSVSTPSSVQSTYLLTTS